MQRISQSILGSSWAVFLRIREGNAFVVGEVGPIIPTLSARHISSSRFHNMGRALIGTLHVAHSGPSRFALQAGADGRGRGL